MYYPFIIFIAVTLAVWLGRKLAHRFKLGKLSHILVTVLLGALLFFILLWAAVCLSILLWQLNDPITM